MAQPHDPFGYVQARAPAAGVRDRFAIDRDELAAVMRELRRRFNRRRLFRIGDVERVVEAVVADVGQRRPTPGPTTPVTPETEERWAPKTIKRIRFDLVTRED